MAERLQVDIDALKLQRTRSGAVARVVFFRPRAVQGMSQTSQGAYIPDLLPLQLSGDSLNSQSSRTI